MKVSPTWIHFNDYQLKILFLFNAIFVTILIEGILKAFLPMDYIIKNG
jgi:hypothetical protein